MRIKATVVPITPNENKIVEAILYVISEADRQQKVATQYDIVKTLFLADRRHLNDYGRPITFDRYIAMKHGPIASRAYDILKENTEEKSRPWTRCVYNASTFRFLNAERSVNADVLSESDIEALHDCFVVVKSLGFVQIRKLTHEDLAYTDAWEDEGQSSAYPMSYAMLFDVPNVEKALEVSFLSENQ